MKTITKTTIFVLLMSVSFGAAAQKYGAITGFNMANMTIKDNDIDLKDDLKSNPGFEFGFVYDIPLISFLSIEPGLFMKKRGFIFEYEYEFGGSMVTEKQTTNTIYIDIPVNAKATFDLGVVGVYALFGPYFGFGIGGEHIYETTKDGNTEKETEDVEWGSDAEKSNFKSFDFGLSFGAGVLLFNSLQVGLNYGMGLANISPTTDNGAISNNEVFSIVAGYRFGGDK